MDIVDKHNQIIEQMEQLRYDLYDMRQQVYYTVISMEDEQLLEAFSRIQDKDLIYMIYDHLVKHPIIFTNQEEEADEESADEEDSA